MIRKGQVKRLAGNDLFTTSRLTEDVRAQLSSRIAMHYPLSGFVLAEAKAFIQWRLGEYATDEAVAQIYNITGGLPRYIETLNKESARLNSSKFEGSGVRGSSTR